MSHVMAQTVGVRIAGHWEWEQLYRYWEIASLIVNDSFKGFLDKYQLIYDRLNSIRFLKHDLKVVPNNQNNADTTMGIRSISIFCGSFTIQ